MAEANGLVQAITITAILFSTFAFSILFEQLFAEESDPHQILKVIAPIGWILVLNSFLQLFMAYRLPTLELGNPEEVFNIRHYLTGKTVISSTQLITSNIVIRLSVIGLAIFWSVGQVLLAAFPAFAKETMAVTNTVVIQGILAATGIGIAIGSALAGHWSKNHIETTLIPVGAVGIATGLVLLPQLDSVFTHIINFLAIGFMGGLFIVPLNALLQFSAKSDEIGKVIAGNNLFQNISMLGFLLLTVCFSLADMPSYWLLNIIAVVAIAGGIYTSYKLPQSLIRIVLMATARQRYSIKVNSLSNIPAQGGALLIGRPMEWSDWALVQIASPRPVRFFKPKNIYRSWFLERILDQLHCIPGESENNSQQPAETVAELLNNGEIVCLFPESMIDETRCDIAHALKLTGKDIQIIPFQLHSSPDKKYAIYFEKINITISFGEPISKDLSADNLWHRLP